MMGMVNARRAERQKKSAQAGSQSPKAANENKRPSLVMGQGRYANSGVRAAEELENMTLPHEEAINTAKFVANKTGSAVSAVGSAVGDAATGTAKLAAWTVANPRQAAVAATTNTVNAVRSAPQNTALALLAGGRVAASGGSAAKMRFQNLAHTVVAKKRFFIAKSEDENKGRRAVREIVIYLMFMIFFYLLNIT